MRKCKQEGCNTTLTQLNKGNYCYVHKRERALKRARKPFDAHDYAPEHNEER